MVIGSPIGAQYASMVNWPVSLTHRHLQTLQVSVSCIKYNESERVKLTHTGNVCRYGEGDPCPEWSPRGAKRGG